LQPDHVNELDFQKKRTKAADTASAFQKAELTREGERQQKISQ